MAQKNANALVADAQRRRWIRNRRIDLLASNAPVISSNYFICFEEEVPEGSVVVVKGIAPYVCERIAVGAANQSFRYISPLVANGWFSFEPVIGTAGGSPMELLLDVNAPTLAAGTLNNNERQASKGLTDVSDNPMRDAALLWSNPLFSFVVPGGSKLQVLFRLLSSIRQATDSPMTCIYEIAVNAGAAIPLTMRVDFAGCLVVGEIMPDALYKAMAARAEAAGRSYP